MGRHAGPRADAATRTCAVCLRPFTWRRKWARDWDAVRYCSDACRSRRGAVTAGAAAAVSIAERTRRSGRTLPRGRR